MGFSPPNTIDLITHEPDGALALIIVHDGVWEGSQEEEDLLLQKINDYLYFLIGGEFDKRCPQAEGKDVRLQIDTASAPPDNIKRLVNQADEQLIERNIRISINIIE